MREGFICLVNGGFQPRIVFRFVAPNDLFDLGDFNWVVPPQIIHQFQGYGLHLDLTAIPHKRLWETRAVGSYFTFITDIECSADADCLVENFRL